MNIIVQRGVVKKIEELEPFSIALDGFVSGPILDNDSHRYSFDHHGNCDRFSTLSSCFQVWTAIMLGLDPQKYNIYINDVDIDTCMAIWCLNNPDRCTEPLAQKLLNAINIADMFSGAIPINGMTKIVEWISAPETDSKRNNDYGKLSEDGLMSILEAILHRVDLYVNGEASVEIVKQHKHGEYKVLRNENGWVLIESNDPHVLAQVFAAGFDRVVKIHYQEDKSLAVTIAKKSDFIDGFNVRKMFNALNLLELGWNGSSSIGGAPRHSTGERSKLPLSDIIKAIDNVVLSAS